jgi:bla regulator protein BlaR1
MILYIIKSVLCSALFIAAYHLLLEKETVHRFKRWYLLLTLLLSLGIPLLTIEIDQPELVTQLSRVTQYLGENGSRSPDSTQSTSITPQNTSFDFSWPTILFVAYGIITAVLLVRIFNNFLSIVSDVNDKTVKPYRDALLVLHNKHVIPYSFLNYIFISHQDSNDKHILLHELTHIRQRHSLDILLVEFIHCLMWFNPAILLYKKAIRLNHEFLADEVVLKNFPTSDYQRILLQKTQVSSGVSLNSSFNYSATKKRFIMMTTIKNQTRSVIKIVMTSILLLGTVLIFSEKVYAQNDSIPQVIPQSKINLDSQAIAEFDKLISKVIQFGTNKAGKELVYVNLSGITDEQRNKAWEFYNGLTDEQKSKYPENIKMGIKFAFTSMPPPAKISPTLEQMTAWADPTVYGVWLDGKRIPNAELANYKSTDIAHVFMSRLMKNAAHYGQYKFHVALMTHPYFDKTYPPKSQ